MKRYLWVKLLICYLFVSIFTLTIINTYGASRLENKLVNNKKYLLYNESISLSSKYMANYYRGQLSLYDLNVQTQALGTMLAARIWIVNNSGQVTYDTQEEISSSEDIDLLEIDPNFLSVTFSDYTYFNGVLSEPMVSVVYPVVYKNQRKGYIVMLSSRNEIKAHTISYMNIINICSLFLLGFLFLVFCYIYFITVLPLKKLNKAASEYVGGNYSYSIHMKQHDEFKNLANSLTYMAGEISNLDDYQKKFVANISHDFRSPLTSIKGYAEALQDGTIPFEMKDKYLGIILFETERLNKLTTSLLALNSFENKGAFLDIVSFDINNIIKKTAESFERTCTEKKITLNLIFSSKEIFVDADMGKIQQVLYNLLDNAIKFSHHNSSIKITTTEKGDKVFVSIKDHGIGIPKDSIKKIWDRFYKTDASRGKDKKGTGLGLSITKEIIAAHNENINVISTEGIGTEFIFSLPRTGGFL